MVNDNKKGENKDRLRLELALDIAQLCMFEVSAERELIYLENAHSVFDASDSVIYRRLKQFDGLDVKRYIERIANSLIHPDDRNLFGNLYKQLEHFNVFSFEVRLLQVSGKYAWCKLTIEPIVVNDMISSVIVAIMNITSSKEKLIKLEESNRMDNFTDLYNKTSSFELINKEIENSRSVDRFAFAILDIDSFKQFNDTYGHDMGDEILKEVAKTLKLHLNNDDYIVGRFGGDEFIILVKNYKDRDSLVEVLSKINTYHVRKHECKATIGISILNEDANTFSKLFKHADNALYQAKHKGLPILFYKDMKENDK